MNITVVSMLTLTFVLGHWWLLARTAHLPDKSILDLASRLHSEPASAQRATQQEPQAAIEWIGNAQDASGEGNRPRTPGL